MDPVATASAVVVPVRDRTGRPASTPVTPTPADNPTPADAAVDSATAMDSGSAVDSGSTPVPVGPQARGAFPDDPSGRTSADLPVTGRGRQVLLFTAGVILLVLGGLMIGAHRRRADGF